MGTNHPTTSQSIKRFDSLDYLRGLAASGVMAYHMSLFSFGESDSSSFIARVKIYAVAIFYVLSGLTLSLVNSKLEANKISLSIFYLKRIFRIIPLLWLATILTYCISSNPELYSFKSLIVNIGVLPGIIRPDKFAANGAWSIGNEIFFYVLFPVLFLINIYKRIYFKISLVLIAIVFIFFTFKILDPNTTLGHQWFNYVNPFNQFFFFAIGIYLPTIHWPSKLFIKFAPFFIFLSVLVLMFYPVFGEPIMLVTGINRIVLSLTTIFLCYMFFLCDFNFLPNFIKMGLKNLGDTSYSIYLLHPILFHLLKMVSEKFFPLNSIVLIAITIVLTLVISKIVFEKFEKRFIVIGKSFIDLLDIKKHTF